MSEKFKGINGIIESEELSKDFENATVFDKMKVGEKGIFYKDGFKTRYIAFSEFERYFKRINEVNGKLCCGSATFAYYKLVIVVGGKEYMPMMTENEGIVDEAVAYIKEKHPEVNYGVGKG